MAQTVKNPPAMQETGAWSLGWVDPLEEGMATHSSIVAWKIPWIEEPGGPQPMGSQSWIWLRDWAEAGHTSPRCERQKALLPQAEELKTKYQIPIRSCMRRSYKSMCPRGLEREMAEGGYPNEVLDKSRFQMKQEADERHTEFQGLWH